MYYYWSLPLLYFSSLVDRHTLHAQPMKLVDVLRDHQVNKRQDRSDKRNVPELAVVVSSPPQYCRSPDSNHKAEINGVPGL